MAIQLSTTARNDRLAGIATAVGASGTLKIYSGSMPANCAASTTGTDLADFTLSSSPFGTPASGAVTLSGLTLSSTGNSGAGTGTSAGYFRIFDGSSNCHLQGTVTATGGGGDMTVDNVSIASGQTVQITGFTLTDGNA